LALPDLLNCGGMARRWRLLLADDHRVLLQGLQSILEREPDFEVAGCHLDGRSLLTAASRLKPDVVVLDISMPVLNGIDTARRLRKLLPKAKIVFLTMHSDAAYVSEAIRVGAMGYVLKRSAASELVRAIRQAVNGRMYITPLVGQAMFEETPGLRRPKNFAGTPLTFRQNEVLQLVAEGRSNKQIASILGVSVKTVEYHKASIMQKLGSHSTAELTQYAMRHGIIGD
jgi:DNA-binding NarL/FixJ family response regulator